MLLINNGLECLADIDAISFRGCHYIFDDGKWQDCIHTAIPVETAVKRINTVCFSRGGLQCIYLTDIIELNDMLMEGDVLGPVNARAIHNDMESECFSGQTKYLYCCGKTDRFYKWHCAYEYPFLLKTLEELWDESGLYIIRLYPLSCLNKRIDMVSVARDSLQYQKNMNMADAEMLPAGLEYLLKRKQKIALQLGLYNYLLQTNRYISFLEHTLKNVFPDDTVVFSELYKLIKEGNYKGFNKCNKQLRIRILEAEKWKI